MNIKRYIAGASAEDTTQETGEVIVSSTFENDIDGFSPRMNEGQSVEVNIVEDGTAHGGNGYLLCTNREKSWQGAQFLTDDVLEGGKKYIINTWIRTPWYATITLSMQYTDSTGNVNYTNIQSVSCTDGNWVQLSDVKVQIPADCTGVYLYFECSDANVDIAIDDFTISSTPEYKIQEDIPSLKDVYSSYFKFGGAMMASELGSQSTKDLVLKHYNSITFGNELKPENVLVQSECQALAQSCDESAVAVSIDSARSLLNFCQENNIPVRGHVLVWHSQTPDWFFKEGYSNDGDWVSKEVMLGRMENYIKNLMELLASEYPDVDFYAWDVVNEIWLDDGNPRQPGEQGSTGSNNSAWVQIFGDNSFVDYAFEYARKYAPEDCKLYYNDFNEYMPSKTTAIVDMVTRLKEKGLIDGIGMQSHLDVSFPSISVYEKALKAFCETGLDVQITELDVTTSDTSEQGLETQAQYYSDIMDLAVKYSDSISAVVVWGTTDDQSWRSAKLPVLFNEDYTAKPCYYSIIDDIDYEKPIVTTTTTTEEPTTTTSVSLTTTTHYVTTPASTEVKIGVVKDITNEYILVETDTGEQIEVSTSVYKGSEINVGDTVRVGYNTSYITGEYEPNTIGVIDTTQQTTTSPSVTTTSPSETTTITDDSSSVTPSGKMGDINGDDKINVADLIALRQNILHIKSDDEINKDNADVTGDGKVNVADLIKIRSYILHTIDSLD